MNIYKVVVQGVDLINELLRKLGEGGGLFKEEYLNLLKNKT